MLWRKLKQDKWAERKAALSHTLVLKIFPVCLKSANALKPPSSDTSLGARADGLASVEAGTLVLCYPLSISRGLSSGARGIPESGRLEGRSGI